MDCNEIYSVSDFILGKEDQFKTIFDMSRLQLVIVIPILLIRTSYFR